MTRSVKEVDDLCLGLEDLLSHVHGDASVTLLPSLIQNPGICEGAFAHLLGLLLIPAGTVSRTQQEALTATSGDMPHTYLCMDFLETFPRR